MKKVLEVDGKIPYLPNSVEKFGKYNGGGKDSYLSLKK
jgi:hypothetical protein